MHLLRQTVLAALCSALGLVLPMTARAHAPAPTMRFATEGAGTVRVSSATFDRAAVAPVVETLRSLIGGRDDNVSVYVADREEIERICGAWTMSCFDSYPDEITIAGIDAPVSGEPRDFALAHEYAHHLANESRGSLWPPLASGTMRWATHEHVCALARDGLAFPGNEGAHYWANPGEAFAQAYAHLRYPEMTVPWSYTPLLAPDAGALRAISLDIEAPWQGPRTLAWRDSSNANRPESRLVETPLDGRITVAVHGAAGSRLRVTLRSAADGAVLASGAGRVARLHYRNCGHREVTVGIQPIVGPAAFRASVTRP